MANTDIRLMLSFKEHRKRKKLNYVMGCKKSGTDYLIDLWISAANDRPEGVLTGWDEVDIALACGWDGEPQQIVDYLIQSGWLDCDEDGTYSLHDWEEYQGWVMGAKRRSENARKAALAKHGCGEHAESMRGACGAQEDCDADSNAPLPYPSPSPLPKNNTLKGIRDEDSSPEQNCPQNEIISAYNKILPELPRCKTFSDQYRKMLRTRWREDQCRQSVEWWEGLFNEIRASDFLMGRVNGWTADLTWIVRPKNFTKIINGNYRNKTDDKRFS